MGSNCTAVPFVIYHVMGSPAALHLETEISSPFYDWLYMQVQVLRKSKDYDCGICVYKGLGIYVSCMKP